MMRPPESCRTTPGATSSAPICVRPRAKAAGPAPPRGSPRSRSRSATRGRPYRDAPPTASPRRRTAVSYDFTQMRIRSHAPAAAGSATACNGVGLQRTVVGSRCAGRARAVPEMVAAGDEHDRHTGQRQLAAEIGADRARHPSPTCACSTALRYCVACAKGKITQLCYDLGPGRLARGRAGFALGGLAENGPDAKTAGAAPAGTAPAG